MFYNFLKHEEHEGHEGKVRKSFKKREKCLKRGKGAKAQRHKGIFDFRFSIVDLRFWEPRRARSSRRKVTTD